MPWYVTRKVVMQEVANQMDKGLSGILHRRKKAPWTIFPLSIILYELKSHKVMETKIQELEHLDFSTTYFHGYHPRWIFGQHCQRISQNMGYSLMSTTEDEKSGPHFLSSMPDQPKKLHLVRSSFPQERTSSSRRTTPSLEHMSASWRNAPSLECMSASWGISPSLEFMRASWRHKAYPFIPSASDNAHSFALSTWVNCEGLRPC